MGEKNLWSKLGLIVLFVGMSIWQVFPWKEDVTYKDRLKQGIDLAGGTSLLFEIDDTGIDRTKLAERVSTVLKKRVDPQGNRNLIWRPIGSNRLEIQMPLPPPGQKENREAFENARDQLLTANITEAEIRTALEMPPEQRDRAFAEMSRLVKSRQALLDKLAAADAKYKQLQAETSRPVATQPAATQPTTNPAYKEMDLAFIERKQLIEKLLQTNLDGRFLGDILELDRKGQTRADRLAELKKNHPDLAAAIDDLVARHDQWASTKGALDDPSDLIRLLRGAGVLEFRILAERNKSNPEMLDSSNAKYNEPVEKYVNQLQTRGPHANPGDNYRWFKITKSEESKGFPDPPYVTGEYLGAKYVLAHSTPDMGLLNDRTWSLKSARPDHDEMGRMSVQFALASQGKFGRLTGANIGRPLAIFLDEEAISAATIQSRINDYGQISGTFAPEYVRYLVNTLEAGALPARLKEVPLQEKTVGPALGATNRSKGQIAILISFAATIAFMGIYYGYNGFVADIALLMNLVITLGVMSFLQGTFTLPGIAGLILTLGMAVDANVLIFERMREELQRGVSARMAVKLGYEKAFSAIFDSNVTTVLTAVILFWIGSEEIKGFGLTLGIGLCISMFTALFVTRQYYYVMIPQTLNQQEIRRTWLGTGLLALAGGVFFGAGYLFNKQQNLAESNLLGLGKFLLVMFGTATVLLLTMWAFRWAYGAIGHRRQNRLPMMRLMNAPKIDWIGKYRIFWTTSCVIIGVGLLLIWNGLRDSKLLDIEFVGGTAVEVQLKAEHQKMIDDEVLAYVTGPAPGGAVASTDWLKTAASRLDQAKVTSAGEGKYTITVPGDLSMTQLQALLMPKFEPHISRGAFTPAEGGITVQIDRDKEEQGAPADAAAVEREVRASADYARDAAGKLGAARVQETSQKTEGDQRLKAFEIVTTETNRPLVSEALLVSMGDLLEIRRPIEARLVKDSALAPDGIYRVSQDANQLGDVIGSGSTEPIGTYKGGLVMVFDELDPPQSRPELQRRLREMRLQPDFESVSWRNFTVIGLEPAPGSDVANPTFKKVAVVVNDPNLPNWQAQNWKTDVADKELALAEAALASTTSLARVTQFAPQVATEAAQKALIAVLLSLIAIAGYLWIRFGSLEFGVAGILALYHDVAVAMAAVVASHYLYDTSIGRLLLLDDFKIDMNVVAALLTIIGFSINDTIVIFDRIRENRGRTATISTPLVNDSVNQTMSRTILTTVTVLITIAIMYIWGGAGIHSFAFTMLIGCITGTYSTFGIACSMLRHPRVMWVVTTVIAFVTLAGVVGIAMHGTAQYVVLGLLLVLAAAGLVRYFARHRGEGARVPAKPAGSPVQA